jgi:hypothetical protein
MGKKMGEVEEATKRLRAVKQLLRAEKYDALEGYKRECKRFGGQLVRRREKCRVRRGSMSKSSLDPIGRREGERSAN